MHFPRAVDAIATILFHPIAIFTSFFNLIFLEPISRTGRTHNIFLLSRFISDQVVVFYVLFSADAGIHLFAGKMLYTFEAIHHVGIIYDVAFIYVCIRYFCLVCI
jgi:hypothetical protein